MHLGANWVDDSTLIEREIAEALQQEKQYERCSYRRTACKMLERLVSKYNSVWCYNDQTPEHRAYFPYIEYKEAENSKQWTFDQYGTVSEEHKFLVDPGRFWSHDLHRSKVYGERPL